MITAIVRKKKVIGVIKIVKFQFQRLKMIDCWILKTSHQQQSSLHFLEYQEMFPSPKMSGLYTVFSLCRHNSSHVLHQPSEVMVMVPPHRVHRTKKRNTVHNGFYVIFVSKYAQESYQHLLLDDQFLNGMLQKSVFILQSWGKATLLPSKCQNQKLRDSHAVKCLLNICVHGYGPGLCSRLVQEACLWGAAGCAQAYNWSK